MKKYVIENKSKDTVTDAMGCEAGLRLFNSLTGSDVNEIMEDESITVGGMIFREATLPELCYVEDGRLYVDGAIEEFSDDRIRIGYDRAVREFGGVVADHDSDEFQEEWNRQLQLMVAKDLTRFYEQKGILDTKVIEDGEIHYSLTDSGSAILA